ncbi:MAG: leucine-rich repeat domain-containing protein [Coriobacteriia bacterium]|nr:leucine-rich repeat domain-containing protein [Coriobacteriia bacterium]
MMKLGEKQQVLVAPPTVHSDRSQSTETRQISETTQVSEASRLLPELLDLYLSDANVDNSLQAGNLVLPDRTGEVFHDDYSGLTLRVLTEDYSDRRGTVSIIGYHGAINSFIPCAVMCPSNHLVYDVVAIEDYAFYDCLELAGLVIIGSSITSIGHCAFYGCQKITELRISTSGLLSVGSNAFSGCTGLKTIVFFDQSESATGSKPDHFSLSSALLMANCVTIIDESAFSNTGVSSFVLKRPVNTAGARSTRQ